MISLIENKCFLALEEVVLSYLKSRGQNWSFGANQTQHVPIKQEQSQGSPACLRGSSKEVDRWYIQQNAYSAFKDLKLLRG